MHDPGDGNERRLIEELRSARDQYLRVLKEFDKLNQEVIDGAHGMVAPDGSLAIASLGKQREFVYRSYKDALGAFSRSVRGPESPAPNAAPIDHGLTPREREVLVLIAHGNSTKKIAEALGIAFKTAACHRGRILSKLDVHNTADLTRAAIRLGLIGW